MDETVPWMLVMYASGLVVGLIIGSMIRKDKS